MLLNVLKAKIHRAQITEANLAYEGSITIDKSILEAAGIYAHEQVHVVDIENGSRFVTYVIEGKPGSGVFCVNGAAARLVTPGDKIIVIAYCQLTPEEFKDFRPRVALIGDKNTLKDAYSLKPGEPIDAGGALSRA